ncbi:Queuine tRNA-ribosyltransferase [Nadsonia fulvescens var. elongata DSM 6958]|uniref:Queuine tRNA-ribosyltransferase catalytic subunit 1 n=1 Tax=Nadsonia fulvescens var. elongata DSM 6958 TaxID=857566 RepID=A0A1E3PM59_9ASCO|nr:Queuine tRNA-ribosyltransferase [Nadsonia fulvescens var. elongata DSM 6958]
MPSPLASSASKALTFNVIAKCSRSKARASTMILPHGEVQTPMFMPVATQASLKGLTSAQLAQLDCKLCLNNTYHLGLKPGQEVLDAVGGAHKLQSWDRNILTDSGGFQMVSLLKLATINEQGVKFLSPHDGTPMLLTPEHSMSLQNSIGSDIIMQLDDVVSTLTTGPRVEEAMWRSIRWLDRCIAAHKYPERQNLFAIIQGGIDDDLRKICCEEMMKRDTPGIAIGGLSGGEDKSSYCRTVSLCTDILPQNKPRYCMGVGYAEDLIVSVALGADLFDCVFPTRTARFGNALTSSGSINVKKGQYAEDFSPLDFDCTCPVCKPKSEGGMGATKAFLHHLVTKETTGAHLLTLHNIHYQLNLMRKAREAIVDDKYPEYVREFFSKRYAGDKTRYPQWCIDALASVNIDLLA